MRITKYAEQFVRVISMALLLVLLFLVSSQVFTRTFFGKSFPAFEELMMVLIAWCAMMCTAYAVRKRGHIAIDFFVKKLSLRKQEYLSIMIDIMLMASLAYILKFAIEFAMRRMRMPMALLPLPNGVTYLSYSVAMFFICLFLLDDIILKIKKLRKISADEIQNRRDAE